MDGVLASLREALVRRSDQFVRVVTEKMLTYALGRGVEYQDMPLVRSIARESSASNYDFSSIVLGIVKSSPFQMNTKTAGEGQPAGGPANQSQEKAATMFITKKHISRRTVLKGSGVTLALPFLEAMVPAATALAATAAVPKPRFVGCFVPHGMAPGYWVPEKEGALDAVLPVQLRNRWSHSAIAL